MILRLVAPVSDSDPESVPGESAPAAEQLSMAFDIKNTVLVPGDDRATWDRAFKKMRDIQKAWKETGPSPAGRDSELWKRFKAATDRFFEIRASMSKTRQEKPRS